MFFCLVFSSLACFLLIYSFTYFCGGSLLLRRLCFGSGERELLCCGTRASHCSGFSPCRAQGLGHAGFCSCATWVQKLRLPVLERMSLVVPQHVGSSRTRDQT